MRDNYKMRRALGGHGLNIYCYREGGGGEREGGEMSALPDCLVIAKIDGCSMPVYTISHQT